MSLALGVDGDADTVGEEPVVGAGKANLFCPVPLSASGVSWEGIGRGEYADSIFKSVSVVAAGTGKSLIGLAEVGDRSTNVVGVEGPMFRTGRAGAISPGSASRVSGGSHIGGGELAGAVDQVVSEVAGEAGSIGGIEGLAKSGRLGADSIHEVPIV